jgi:FAD/FMN-containing dehydrogenase
MLERFMGRRPAATSLEPRAEESPGFDAAKRALQEQIAGAPPGAPLRLHKRTSNLFRTRHRDAHHLETDDFAHVLSVDRDARQAEVGGLTTYEDLVDATLPHSLMPLVVPQLKTITLGGAVAGLGIESTSFRSGLPHESVTEMEILTGSGDIVVARPEGPHSDLFATFPNSYGTLGYALRLQIELEPVRPYVALRHLHFTSFDDCVEAMGRICSELGFEDQPVDFLDGTVFSRDEMYLTLGSFVDSAPWTSDYKGKAIYYKSIGQKQEDYLTIRDYLWRWDTDWFWCSRAFGAQHPVARRFWPKRYLRSDVYHRILSIDRRWDISKRIDRVRQRPEAEAIIQDVELPLDRTAEFLDFFFREIPIQPVWLCPLRQRPGRTWPLYKLDPDTTYVNAGFWSSLPLPPGAEEGFHNRKIEQTVTDLGGRKSLYSTSYYSPEEFWSYYGGNEYREIKERYDPEGRLLDLYAKCVERR